MVESPQIIYVHDSYKIQDKCEKWDISLNTRGEAPSKARSELYKTIDHYGVDPAKLYKYTDKDIGKVWFDQSGNVDRIRIYEWVFDEAGLN